MGPGIGESGGGHVALHSGEKGADVARQILGAGEVVPMKRNQRDTAAAELEVAVIDDGDRGLRIPGAGEGDDGFGEVAADEDVLLGQVQRMDHAIDQVALLFHGGGFSVATDHQEMRIQDGPEPPEHQRAALEEAFEPGQGFGLGRAMWTCWRPSVVAVG